MKKLIQKAQAKIGIIAMLIIAIGLIATITSILVGSSNTKINNINSNEKNVAIVDIQKLEDSKIKQTVEILPIVTVPQNVGQTEVLQESSSTSENKQTEVTVKSIQDAQPQVEAKLTPPPKPVIQEVIIDKTVKPTYKEPDVKPQQGQPKMGDKNDKGQIYIDGFGWIKDEGGGGKGTTVGKQGDQLTGNKVGKMN